MKLSIATLRGCTQSLSWLGAWTTSAALHAVALVALGLMLIAVPSASDAPVILAHLDETSQATPLDELRLAAAEAAATGDHLLLIESVRGDVQATLVGVGPEAPSDVATGRGDAAFGLPAEFAADLPLPERTLEKPMGKLAGFYGIEAAGNEFVYVVDMSGSMEGSRFRRARNELRRSIDSLGPYQRYFVIFFSDGAYPMPAEELLPRTDKNLQATVRWLNQIQCDGPTNPLPALLQAIDMKPDAVFLLSDGKFPMEIVVEVAEYRTDDAIPIHTISFASREGEPMLKAIAKATGGTYRYVK